MTLSSTLRVFQLFQQISFYDKRVFIESRLHVSTAQVTAQFDTRLPCHALKRDKKNRSAMQTCVAYQLPWSQRFFLSLRGSGFFISYREKSRKSSGTGVLTSRFYTYHWNPVDFPVCRFGYKKNDSRKRLVQV